MTRILRTGGFAGFALNFLLGAVAVLGHAPFYLWPVTIICLALFLLRLDGAYDRNNPLRAGFWCGFGFALGYFVAGLYWVGSAFVSRPGFELMAPFGVLGLSVLLALIWALGGLLYIRLCRGGARPLWRAGIFTGVFFIAEFTRGHLFGGFPWNLPGYIFPAGKPISQIASMIGVYGLSALVLLLSGGFGVWLSNRRQWHFMAACLLLLVGCYGYGALRLERANIQYVDDVKLRIVHASIPQKDKFDGSKFVEIVNTYLELSRSEGLENVTHVIWPEGAVPGLIFETPGLLPAIENTLRSSTGEPPVFITQTLRAEKILDKIHYYNAAATVTFRDGQSPLISSYYDKQKLVPFGEFIPGGGVLERIGLSSLSTALESMTPGKSGAVPELPGLPPASVQICYEIIFSGFTERAQPSNGQGGKWILNLSNDSWYGNSTGPRQHINQARYRAIEQGLPVVRATSGGISGIIDPYGRQLNALNLGARGIIDAHLPRELSEKTAYKAAVNYRLLLLIFLLLIGCTARMHREP